MKKKEEEVKERGKAGRPELKLTEEQLELLTKLASIQCSPKEMGFIMGYDFRTLVKWHSDIIEQGKANGKLALRRKQMEVAMSGNPTLLIWLGKNWLNQTDVPLSESDAKILPWNDDVGI